LTGQMPFTGSSAISTALMHTQDEPPLPSTLLPDLAPEIETVILRAIAKSPAQRYNTAGDFARALRVAAKYDEMVQNTNVFPSTSQNQQSSTVLPKLALHAVKQTVIKCKPLKPQVQSKSGIRNALFVAFCSLLILGGLLASLSGSTPLPQPVSAHTHKTPTVQLTQQSTTSPTVQPTASPTAQPPNSSIEAGPMPLVSVGAQLYASTLLGSVCPGVHGAWSQDVNARVTCGGTSTELANSLPPTIYYLAGMFLNGLADGSGIPNNYILQVETTQEPSSQGYFGVLFRNQPDQSGHRHNGSYAFLINPNDGTWKAVVYEDVSGLPTFFANGQFSFPANTSMIIDIIVQENTFTFYLNGVLLSQVAGPVSPNYSSGTIGFAVSTSTVALFKNLAVYALP
jgi:3-keto-disaccharide hydrolase